MNVKTTRLENLNKLIEEFGTAVNIEKKSGVNAAYISQIINRVPLPSGNPRGVGDKMARSLENGLNKPHGWMDVSHDSNVREVDVRGEAVPVISWVAAGNFCAISDPYLPGTAERWPVPHSKSTYALVVTGLSMHNPNGKPSFEDGEIIFVDPEVPAKNKSCVIVRLDDRQEATFKQLIIEAGSKYLVPLNPDWPEKFIEVNENATICGVVIGKWTDI